MGHTERSIMYQVGSFEELMTIIAAGYAAGKAFYEGVKAVFRWFKK